MSKISIHQYSGSSIFTSFLFPFLFQCRNLSIINFQKNLIKIKEPMIIRLFQIKFKNKKITGILSVLQSNEINYLYEIGNYNFSEKQSIKLGKIMGYGSRRIVDSNTSVSDLCDSSSKTPY